MSSLIIVESPTKARTLSRFLGSGYRIEATMGHVRDLPKSKLGVEIRVQNSEIRDQKLNSDHRTLKSEKYDFIPEYQVIPDRRKRVTELKKLTGQSEEVILATDPDREGEAIAWHVKSLLKLENRSGKLEKKIRSSKLDKFPTSNFKLQSPTSNFQPPTSIKRIIFHEITQSAIKQALMHPHNIDIQLVDAQQARRILDRLVGYKLSPLLWNKLGKKWLSAGRVQSVAVRLIVEREREIEAFVSKEFWVIDVELHKEKSEKDIFTARLTQINGKKADLVNKDQAQIVAGDLEKSAYKISDIQDKELRRYPASPFTTSTLQQAASNRFGWSARRTIKTAQTLYEEGFITYHRTDSTNLAAEALDMARIYINNVYGDKYVPVLPRIYKTKSKVAQEAHEAIRPTDVRTLGDHDIRRLRDNIREENKLKVMGEELGRDAQMLYSLIWKRFLACQMNEAVIHQTQVNINAAKEPAGPSGNQYVLTATGERMAFDGWMVLYDKTHDRPEEENGDRKNVLPPLAWEEKLGLEKVIPQQKFTQPPARYTEAGLIKALEEKGIGRPSTYAPIISTIQDRKYVEKKERKFYPTDLGKTVNDFLVKYFPQVFDIDFTSRMEGELDDIANGKLKWTAVVSDFYAPFNVKLQQVFKEARKVKVDLGETHEKCPKCGSLLAIRLSKYGKFLACSAFPKCDFTKNFVEKAGIKCPKCGGEIIVKKTRHGKQFYGCENYPKCTFAAWKKEEIH